MNLKTKIAAGIVAGLALTGITSTANAAPAEAATTIHSKYYDGRYWGISGAYYMWLPGRYYWVDYNWFEEAVQGKRDCYCKLVPLL